MSERVAFIGGGNMASAIISGLIEQGFPPDQVDVVEPFAEAQAKLLGHFGIIAHERPDAFLAKARMIIWAVKPQVFKEAALQMRFHARGCLHLSVAAGIRSDSMARWLDTDRIVRAMPNTPALIGKGISALYARSEVSRSDQNKVEQVMASTGDFLWVANEDQLDAATAISGSGPAYMFYFMEAMTAAGAEMGLTREQAYKLTVATFIGAGELARSADEPPEILRQRVTSKGGTTHAAITSMEDSDIKALFTKALHAAQVRARELGDEFG